MSHERSDNAFLEGLRQAIARPILDALHELTDRVATAQTEQERAEKWKVAALELAGRVRQERDTSASIRIIDNMNRTEAGLEADAEAIRFVDASLPHPPETWTALLHLLRERVHALEDGWDREHDDAHGPDVLPSAAIVELMLALEPDAADDPGASGIDGWNPFVDYFPWRTDRSYEERLRRAGQFIVAELERLERIAPSLPDESKDDST